MGNVFPIVCAALLFLITGCAGDDYYAKINASTNAVAELRLGMTYSEAKTHLANGAWFVRREQFRNKDNKVVWADYIHTGVKRYDSNITDDETTVLVFIDDKLEAVLPGENSKEVIEVRFR